MSSLTHFMNSSKNIIYGLCVGIILVGFSSYSFIKAYDESVWFPPESGSVPPQNNVAAPLNVGSSTQTKIGSLGIGNTLGLFGDKPLVVYVNSDTAVPRWVTAAVVETPGISTMKFLYDRDNNGSVWNNSNAILELHAGGNGASDYAQFSNSIRANNYCDKNGDNCFDPSDPVSSETDLSAIHTYSTLNNTRNVSGAACSCNAGDYLTSCNASGQPMVSSDANACKDSEISSDYNHRPICTCLSTKPTPSLCAVTIKGDIYNTGYQAREAFNMTKTVTIQVPKGALIGVGAWTDVNYTYRDAKFTGGDLLYVRQDYDDNTNTAVGYWNESDYAVQGPAFVDYFMTHSITGGDHWLWGHRRGFIVKPGVGPQTVSVENNWQQDGNGSIHRKIFTHLGTITATVGTCQ